MRNELLKDVFSLYKVIKESGGKRMSGKYIKPLVEVAKAQGPKAVKVIRENPKEIMAVLGAVKVVKTKFDERKKKKVEEGKIPLRKERFDEFNKSILKNLNDYNREQLFNYKLEVKEFIEQIDKEMAEETKAKKPLHVKRRKNWEALLTQIDSKLKTKDYGEYVKIYNNNDYVSVYFEAFERNVQRFKELSEKGDSKEIINFLIDQTGVDETVIRNEFLVK